MNTWYYIANHTPMSHRGRFGGIFPFVTGSGRAIVPYFGGQIIQRFGLGILWLVTSAITTGGALGIKLLDREKPENNHGDRGVV